MGWRIFKEWEKLCCSFIIIGVCGGNLFAEGVYLKLAILVGGCCCWQLDIRPYAPFFLIRPIMGNPRWDANRYK